MVAVAVVVVVVVLEDESIPVYRASILYLQTM